MFDDMFKGNTEKDDIAILANLLSQATDQTELDATVYDPVTGTDWGIDGVLAYIRRKYGENF